MNIIKQIKNKAAERSVPVIATAERRAISILCETAGDRELGSSSRNRLTLSKLESIKNIKMSLSN